MSINLIMMGLLSLALFVSHELGVYVDYLGMGLIVIGLGFFLGTSIGLYRFPDFYTRMHAAGKGDTLSTMLILLGVAMMTLNHSHVSLATFLVGIKILVIVNFIFIGSPTATHAMMDAGYETGVRHWSKSS